MLKKFEKGTGMVKIKTGIAAEASGFCSNPFCMDKVSLKSGKEYIYSLVIWITFTE